MKSDPIKCVLIKTLTELGPKESIVSIEFRCSGKYSNDVYRAVNENNLAVGSALEITIDKVNAGQTAQQRKTWHMLVDILWDSQLCYDKSKTILRERLKLEFGPLAEPVKYKRDGVARVSEVAKSTTTYNRKTYSHMIDKIIEYINLLFMEGQYYDKRYDACLREWNDYKKANPEKKKPVEIPEEEEIF